MTARITNSIRRATRRTRDARQHAVHYHVDGGGRGYACHSGSCALPMMTLREASLTETGARRRTR